MQISSNHNMAIIAGLPRQDQPRQGQTPLQAQPKSVANTAVISQPESVVNSARPVRPAVHVQPMFDQALTYRGEQARRTYQDVELGGEVELMQRLDVKV